MCQVLLTYKGQNLAVLDVESKWQPNKAKETKMCYGSSSLEHPGVQMVAMERGKYYLGGAIRGLELPKRLGGVKRENGCSWRVLGMMLSRRHGRR
jgi:sulfate adenylyltransferase